MWAKGVTCIVCWAGHWCFVYCFSTLTVWEDTIEASLITFSLCHSNGTTSYGLYTVDKWITVLKTLIYIIKRGGNLISIERFWNWCWKVEDSHLNFKALKLI